MALKLRDRQLFPKVFNAADRAYAGASVSMSLPGFMKLFSAELRKRGIPVELLSARDNLLFVDKTFLVLVVDSSNNIRIDVARLKARMRAEGLVLVGLIIQLENGIRWRRIRISEKWLKEQDSQT
jgi:hypothetical protein